MGEDYIAFVRAHPWRMVGYVLLTCLLSLVLLVALDAAFGRDAAGSLRVLGVAAVILGTHEVVVRRPAKRR